jgi:hypothetical protein
MAPTDHASRVPDGTAPQATPALLLAPELAAVRITSTIKSLASMRSGVLGLLRTTMGSGKSTAVREIAAASEQEWLLLVPMYPLAEEHLKKLRELGLPVEEAEVERPITGARHNGKPECVQQEVALRLSSAGLDPAAQLCGSCPYAAAHPRTGGTCPAKPAKGGAARIRIRAHTRAAEILRFTRWTCAKSRAPLPIVCIDEPPDTMTVRPYQGDAQAISVVLASMPELAQERIAPAIEAVVRALDEGFTGSLRACLERALDPGKVEDVLRALNRSVVGVSGEAANDIGSHIAKNKVAADRFRDARELIGLMIEASFRPNHPLIVRKDREVRLVARAAWVREVAAYVRAGGKVILLDATIDVNEVRSLGIGAGGIVKQLTAGDDGAATAVPAAPARRAVPLVVTDVHVEDHEGAERIFYRWASGPRSHHVSMERKVRWKELQGVLRHLAGLVAAKGGPLGIITDQPTREALSDEWDRLVADPTAKTPLPPEFAKLAGSGLTIIFGHFNAHRGLNAWEGVKVHAVIGDHFLPVADVAAIGAYFGKNEHIVARWRCQAEIQQAIGRARPPWFPSTLVHYGSRRPSLEMAPQWASAAEVTSKTGRPRRVIEASTEGLAAERLRLGVSKREHAKVLGLPIATYLAAEKRDKGSRAPDEEQAELEEFYAGLTPELADATPTALLVNLLAHAREAHDALGGAKADGVVVVAGDRPRLIVESPTARVSIEHGQLAFAPLAYDVGALEAFLGEAGPYIRKEDGVLTDGVNALSVGKACQPEQSDEAVTFDLYRTVWKSLRSRMRGGARPRKGDAVQLVWGPAEGTVFLRDARTTEPLGVGEHDVEISADPAYPNSPDVDGFAAVVSCDAFDTLIGAARTGAVRFVLSRHADGRASIAAEHQIAIDRDGARARHAGRHGTRLTITREVLGILVAVPPVGRAVRRTILDEMDDVAEE